jgi:hypothetical protein
MTADLHIENHGTISLLYPVSEVGTEWVEEHIPDDPMTWGDAVIVEHRFIADIAEGAMDDGLEVS